MRSFLFVPEGLDGVELGGAPGGEDRREERQRQRHDDDRDRLAEIHVGRKLAEEIEFRVEQRRAGNPREELADRFDIEADEDAEQDAGEGADRADGRTETTEVLLRLDNAMEIDYYRHGGILQKVLRQRMQPGTKH